MRLIDADNLKIPNDAPYKASVKRVVAQQPTVETVPVEAICDDLLGRYKRAHGEWIYNQYHTWECGNCGFHPFKGFIPKEPGFNFCPNCGADMRKKV